MASLLRRFRLDTRGNIAVMFIIALLPILTAVGCAIDYSLATKMRAKMQSAADAASVASISQKSAGFIQAAAMTSDGSVSAGVTDATNLFNGNLNATTGYSNLTLSATVTKTGSVLASAVSFKATVPTTFMNVVGFPSLTITGSSKSSASLPLYLDFYLMLDVSSSMGLPSTNAEQTRLAAVNPDNYGNYPTGCTLACHFATTDVCTNGGQKYPTANYCLGYLISRTSQIGYAKLLQNHSGQLPSYRTASLPSSLYANSSSFPSDPVLTAVTSCATDGTDPCIQLRADAVGYAVTQLFPTALANEQVTNQFRIGLYPFVQYLYAYFPLTGSINGSSSTPGTINYAAANLASQLDTNTNSNLGSGGTHLDTAFSTMNTTIVGVGNGSTSNNTLPYVFLITDGAQDPQVKGINGGGWSGSNQATVMASGSTSPCAALRRRGITIAVLYIPYQPIQNPNSSFAGNEDGAANNNIPYIEPSLQSCATAGFYFKATSPADINSALNAMFNKVLVTAHITN
jgi:Flp pilus assembly protein TadG